MKQIWTHATHRPRVAVAQYWFRPIDEFAQFADQVASIVATSAGYRARLLVLPEYFTAQLFALDDPHRPIDELVRRLCDHRDAYVSLMSDLAKRHGMYIVAGTLPVRDPADSDIVYNDAFLFGPSGAHATQGKLHMTRFERESWRVSQRSQLRVFDTELGRLGIAVCYDVEFPEFARRLGRAGVHVLAVPSSTDDRHGFLRVRYCAHARAIENQMYVLHSPTVGSLPRVPDVSLNHGNAAILTPCDFSFARDGILAEGVLNEEDLVIGELDMRAIEETRTFGTVLPLEDSRRTETLISQLEVIEI